MFRWMIGKPETDSPRDLDARARAHGIQVFSEAREELNRADMKAQVLLGIAGVGIGAVAGGLLAGNWSPLKLHAGLQWVWWSGAACALGALICLAGAVYPRITKRRFGIAFFGDIGRYRTAADLAAALRAHAADDLTRLAEEIRSVSRIVVRKYQLIRWGFWLLLLSVAATVGPALVQLVL